MIIKAELGEHSTEPNVLRNVQKTYGEDVKEAAAAIIASGPNSGSSLVALRRAPKTGLPFLKLGDYEIHSGGVRVIEDPIVARNAKRALRRAAWRPEVKAKAI